MVLAPAIPQTRVFTRAIVQTGNILINARPLDFVRPHYSAGAEHHDAEPRCHEETAVRTNAEAQVHPGSRRIVAVRIDSDRTLICPWSVERTGNKNLGRPCVAHDYGIASVG